MQNNHWRKFDFKIESLKITISGLEDSISKINEKFNEFAWYDGIYFLEESEPIYGLGFIAMQNYINSSIYDRFESLEKQFLKYKNGNKINGSERTDIELIISIANYYKHRDHPNMLIGETPKILSDLNLQFEKTIDINDSPIIKGLQMLSESWDLMDILKTIVIWREKLWLIDDDETLTTTKTIY